LGFGLGILFFPLPDKFGRKKTMKYLMIAYIVAVFLSIEGNNIFLKSLGMFI